MGDVRRRGAVRAGEYYMMQFIREIPENKIADKVINDLTQYGFTLVWTKDSVEVYAEVSDTRLAA